MSEQEPPRTVIGLKTAIVLYGALVLFAVWTLTGKMLALALIIVLGLAAKSLVDYFRRRV